MKFFRIISILILTAALQGCYTVVYHSNDSEVTYNEPIYIPIPVPVPVPIPDPTPGPYHPLPVPNDPPKEKVRIDDNNSNDRNDSYKDRDPIRNTGGRGTEERRNQGR